MIWGFVLGIALACAGFALFYLLHKTRQQETPVAVAYVSSNSQKRVAGMFAAYFGTQRDPGWNAAPHRVGGAVLSLLSRYSTDHAYLWQLAQRAVDEDRLPDVVEKGSEEYTLRSTLIGRFMEEYAHGASFVQE